MKNLVTALAFMLLCSAAASAQLREGVYRYLQEGERKSFVKEDTTSLIPRLTISFTPTVARVLNIEREGDKLAVIYYVSEIFNGNIAAVSGINGAYDFVLNPKKKKYKEVVTEDEARINIELVGRDTVLLTLSGATVNYFYSGGSYYTEKRKLPDETFTLTYERGETEEGKKFLGETKQMIDAYQRTKNNDHK